MLNYAFQNTVSPDWYPKLTVAVLYFFLLVLLENEVLWPSGSYGLPMSAFGCPGGDNWTNGGVSLSLEEKHTGLAARDTFWRYHYNYMGPYEPQSFLHNFCVRDRSSMDERGPESSVDWMEGMYCIYQVTDSCPRGEWNLSFGLNRLVETYV